VFQTYVSPRWDEVPAVLFGLGAVMVARNPEGAIMQNARQLRALIARRRPGADPVEHRRNTPGTVAPGEPAEAPS
jgi:branched-chain amino acid transport system permease protein